MENTTNYLQSSNCELYFGEYVNEIVNELSTRFDLTVEDVEDILDWYMNDIEDAFFDDKGYVNVQTLVSSFIANNKLQWKKYL